MVHTHLYELTLVLLQLDYLDIGRNIFHTYPRYNLCIYPLAPVYPWDIW